MLLFIDIVTYRNAGIFIVTNQKRKISGMEEIQKIVDKFNFYVIK